MTDPEATNEATESPEPAEATAPAVTDEQPAAATRPRWRLPIVALGFAAALAIAFIAGVMVGERSDDDRRDRRGHWDMRAERGGPQLDRFGRGGRRWDRGGRPGAERRMPGTRGGVRVGSMVVGTVSAVSNSSITVTLDARRQGDEDGDGAGAKVQLSVSDDTKVFEYDRGERRPEAAELDDIEVGDRVMIRTRGTGDERSAVRVTLLGDD